MWQNYCIKKPLQISRDKPILVLQSTVRDAEASRRSLTPGEKGDYSELTARLHSKTKIIAYAQRSHFIHLDEPELLLHDIRLWMKDKDLI